MTGSPDDAAVWDLVDALYTSATDGLWSPVPARAEAVFGAPASLGVFGPSPGRGTDFFGASMLTSQDLDAYRAYYHQIDPTLPDRTGIEPGRVEYLSERFDPRQFERTEFYHDFMRPKGVAPDGLCARMPIPSDLGTVAFALWFPRDREWSASDHRRLLRFLPHLHRATQLQLRFACLVHERAGLHACLDHLPAAVFLLDRKGEVVTMNAAAERLARDGRGLRLTGRKLACEAPESGRRLAMMIGEVVSGRETPDGRAVFSIERSAGERALEAMVSRIPCLEPERARAIVAAVFVRDPASVRPPSVQLLRRLYGLTRAEAEIAVRLGEGMSPAEAAEQLGITVETARSQLKKVFQKTGTNRQAALVRLLAGSLTRLLPSDPEPA